MKNQGKSDKTFFYILVLHNVDDKISLIVFFVSRTSVRARLPTAMLIFAVTSVTQRGNFDGKTDQFLEEGKEIEKDFGSCSRCVFYL